MPSPFAALEARVDQAVFARLSNADGVVAGVPMSGIFDDDYQQAGVGPIGMASSQPVFTVPAWPVPAAAVGQAVTVRGRSFTVGAVEPDGAGMVRLLLEVA